MLPSEGSRGLTATPATCCWERKANSPSAPCCAPPAPKRASHTLGDVCGRHKPPAQRSGSFHKAESLPVWIENLNSSILRGHLRTGETCYPPLGTQGAAAARVSQVDQVRLRPAGDEVRAPGWEAAAHARGLTFRPERSSSALSTRQTLATPFAPSPTVLRAPFRLRTRAGATRCPAAGAPPGLAGRGPPGSAGFAFLSERGLIRSGLDRRRRRKASGEAADPPSTGCASRAAAGGTARGAGSAGRVAAPPPATASPARRRLQSLACHLPTVPGRPRAPSPAREPQGCARHSERGPGARCPAAPPGGVRAPGARAPRASPPPAARGAGAGAGAAAPRPRPELRRALLAAPGCFPAAPRGRRRTLGARGAPPPRPPLTRAQKF